MKKNIIYLILAVLLSGIGIFNSANAGNKFDPSNPNATFDPANPNGITNNCQSIYMGSFPATIVKENDPGAYGRCLNMCRDHKESCMRHATQNSCSFCDEKCYIGGCKRIYNKP